MQFPVVGSLSRGSGVEVVEVRNGWCRLANGHWASADYLRPDSAATLLPRAAVVAGQVLPSFASLWQNYPRDALDAVKRMIGGEVDSPDIKNTCTIRLSRALNYSGHPVPARYPGLWVASGADVMWYALRVRDMRCYVEARYGPPAFHWPGAEGADEEIAHDRRTPFLRHRGIILFLADFTNATGHFDIWDGIGVRFHDYFYEAREILLWPTNW